MNHLALILHNPAPFWEKALWVEDHDYRIWKRREEFESHYGDHLRKFIAPIRDILNSKTVLLKKRRYRLKGKRATIPLRWPRNP